MRQSQLFTKTKRENPADETSKNAQLLIRAGYIHKEMAGVYTILPLGLRIVDKITAIIKEEMNLIGGIEMRTSALQTKEVWEKTNRWDDHVVDNWFKTSLKNGTELGLSFTNEEAYSSIMKNFINSYKDLPIYPYDFKTIFRNETRSKSGIMRGREFYWKALYSFSKDEIEHNAFYEKMKQSYLNIFNRVGLGDRTYLTFASGGTFSKYSHEFQTISDAGEDIVYVHNTDYGKGTNMETGRAAINKEIFTDDVKKDLGIDGDFQELKAIEVGNIFSLGFKFSEPFELTYKNEEGNEIPVFMGSYGIGITRLMGTIVETLSDDKGIIWPEAVAPFKVHLVLLGENENAKQQAEDLYTESTLKGVEVLFDDRVGLSIGEKLNDADLLGMPYRVVISEKSLEKGGCEIKKRNETNSQIMSTAETIDYFN
jgi:prolyl-tRNA synthetase